MYSEAEAERLAKQRCASLGQSLSSLRNVAQREGFKPIGQLICV